MSKQSEAKVLQGYVAKPVPKTCMNCQHFKSDNVLSNTWMGKDYYKETNLRCGLGGFAVKKMATCNEFIAIENLTIEMGVSK